MGQFWEIPSKDNDASRAAKVEELRVLQKRAGVVGFWDVSGNPAIVQAEINRLTTLLTEQASKPKNPLTSPIWGTREQVAPKAKRDPSLTLPKWDMPPKKANHE